MKIEKFKCNGPPVDGWCCDYMAAGAEYRKEKYLKSEKTRYQYEVLPIAKEYESIKNLKRMDHPARRSKNKKSINVTQ